MQAELNQFPMEFNLPLRQSLAVTGEDPLYFARVRAAFTAQVVARRPAYPVEIVHYGCGDGSGTALLAQAFPSAFVKGLDHSEHALEKASAFATHRIKFESAKDWAPAESADLIFLNGVMRHVPAEKRPEFLATIRRGLRRGGLLAMWENNPWNLGTKIVMMRRDFEKGAKTISPIGARLMLMRAGFHTSRSYTMFYFPRMLGLLRVTEPMLRKLPFGGQHLTLCRR